MLRNLLLPIIALFCSPLFAQYWQQQVDYRISVKLDDNTHRLFGEISFDYLNNAPVSLDSLYIHVWPNAYSNGESALAKQLERESTKLSLMDSTKLGGISGLDFKINGNPVMWSFHPKHNDIVRIKLPQPLSSGQQLTLSTPFIVKIPSGSISRLGHIGQSYQITQWYPKPAVFDHKGWHPIPYLNQGEFYSEFGSFDVSITVPKNYVIGSTGVLQNSSEAVFLDSLAQDTKIRISEIIALPKGSSRDSFPPTASEWKTLRYVQDKVHDFAWFADKRYKVLKGSVKLPESGRNVTTWALFTPANALNWQNAIEYINDGTYFYSKWNGDYPYDAVTAVDGTISAGGGMEYPMITVIGNSSSARELEVVIVHEVGHNWFYGILGSNERQHGWMDEGMNTANEMRYMATKYPDNQDMSDMVLGGKLHLNNLDHHDMGDIFYRLLAVLALDQPIETHSAEFSSVNYGAIMYQKTGLVFQYLRSYLGDELYDQCMHRYFDLYKFKHPYPEDMQRVVEGVSGRKLNWLFKDLIQTTKTIDYKVTKAKYVDTLNTYTVKVKNNGSIAGPIGISSLDKNGSVLETQWTNPNDKRSTLIFFGNPSINEFAIDPNLNIPEIDRTNNRIYVNKQVFKKQEPLVFEFMFGDHESNKRNVFWTPMMAFNHSDRAMLGVALHNFGLPFNPFQYLVVPMFSFGRKTVGGLVEISNTSFPSNKIRSIKIGLSLKSFGIGNDPNGQIQSYFIAATPYLDINLIPDKTPKGLRHNLIIKGLVRRDDYGFEKGTEYGAKINHSIEWRGRRFSHESQLQLEGIMGYQEQVFDPANVTRVSITQQLSLMYLDRRITRSITFRFYGGYNITYNPGSTYYNAMGRYSISMFGAAGYQDVFAENYYFNRETVFGSQYSDDMGGFRTGSNNLRMSNYWASAVNTTIQLPIKPNLFEAYADFGIYDNGIGITYLYNAGFGINISDIVGLYFPLVQSSNLGDLYSNYLSSFRLTLRINPFNLPIHLSTLINN